MKTLAARCAKRGLFGVQYPLDRMLRTIANPRGFHDLAFYRRAVLDGTATPAKALRFARFEVTRNREDEAKWRGLGGYLP